MQTLSRGARMAQVAHLQRLLNWHNFNAGFPETDLSVDSDFGPRTQDRLRRWQTEAGITPATGQADMRTWHDLGQLTEIDHNVTLFPQPTGESCWSASATMLFGDRSVGPGSATMAGATSRTGFNRGTTPHELWNNQANVRTFLTGAGLTYVPGRAFSIQELVGFLRRGPLWVAGRWTTATASGGHVVVVSGVWADQTMDPLVTTFRIHDPWPPTRGAIYAAEYVRNTFSSLARIGTSFNSGIDAIAYR